MFRFALQASGELKVVFSLAPDEDDEIFSHTFSGNAYGLVSVKWMQIYITSVWENNFGNTPLQLRNLRNPDKAASSCLNNVGSFQCVSNDEENIAVGWGGHTTNSGHRYGAFSVVLADGTTCIDHGIPEFGGRYATQIGVLGKVMSDSRSYAR